MIALIQRVSQASVAIDGAAVEHATGAIGAGLLVLLCAQKGDTPVESDRLLARLLKYRVFADAAGKMNLSVSDVGGSLLIVSQFTLAANTQSGTRPSFGPAADPIMGERLYDYFVKQAKASGVKVATGRFGSDMAVSLVNDGPVTFWLEISPAITTT